MPYQDHTSANIITGPDITSVGKGSVLTFDFWGTNLI